MTFSFDPSIPENLDLVRFHIGDTKDEGHYIEDETIEYLLEQDGATVGSVVISSIKVIIAALSAPDFKLDWMTVTGMDKARKGFQELLAMKQAEFGVYDVMVTSKVSHPYRADSRQDPDDAEYGDDFS